jgi:hypothetical protein
MTSGVDMILYLLACTHEQKHRINMSDHFRNKSTSSEKREASEQVTRVDAIVVLHHQDHARLSPNTHPLIVNGHHPFDYQRKANRERIQLQTPRRKGRVVYWTTGCVPHGRLPDLRSPDPPCQRCCRANQIL